MKSGESVVVSDAFYFRIGCPDCICETMLTSFCGHMVLFSGTCFRNCASTSFEALLRSAARPRMKPGPFRHSIVSVRIGNRYCVNLYSSRCQTVFAWLARNTFAAGLARSEETFTRDHFPLRLEERHEFSYGHY